MTRSTWTTRIILPGALAALAVVAAVAPAQASYGYVETLDSHGSGSFTDANDLVKACDTAIDGWGVITYIKVQQANGSWKTFPRMYDGKGGDTCNGGIQDVLRESATMTITACLAHSATDPNPTNCRTATFSGA